MMLSSRYRMACSKLRMLHSGFNYWEEFIFSAKQNVSTAQSWGETDKDKNTIHFPIKEEAKASSQMGVMLE